MENVGLIKDFLQQAISLQDLENIADKVKSCLGNKNLSLQEKQDLAKMRQRIYERKHRMKNETKEPDNNARKHFSIIDAGTEPVKNLNQDINLKKNIFNIAQIILLIVLNLFFSYITWEQSCELYAGLRFANASLIALSGLVISILPVLCLNKLNKRIFYPFIVLIIGYELMLIVSTTFLVENQATVHEMKKNTHYLFLLEEYNKNILNYNENKNKYNDVNSKLYKNAWFKNKQLMPSWERVSIALQKLRGYEGEYLQENSGKINKVLKVFYRLLLLISVMITMRELKLTINLKNRCF